MGDILDQFDRYESLAAKLVELGVPRPWSRCIAEGIVAHLRRHCWCVHSDVIGSAQDIEAIVEWGGLPLTLCKALLAAGFLAHEAGEFYLPSATIECPEYVRRRWREHNLTSHRRAKARSQLVYEYPARQAAAIVDEAAKRSSHGDDQGADTSSNLWGDVDDQPIEQPAPRRSPDESIAGFVVVRKHWFDAYERRYGRRYAFRAKDGAHLKAALRAESDIKRLTAALDAYLACTDPFYIGHDLGLFIARINRWLPATDAAAGRDKPTPIRYRRDGEALPSA